MQLRITQDENVNGIPVFKSKKDKKSPKKCFTKSVDYETLYLSRGTGPLDSGHPARKAS